MFSSLMVDGDTLLPHRASVISSTRRTDTPARYISMRASSTPVSYTHLDERTNGLSYAAEKMKGSPLCWQVTMSAEECERSALAMDAVKRM